MVFLCGFHAHFYNFVRQNPAQMQQIKIQYPLVRLLMATNTHTALMPLLDKQAMRVAVEPYMFAGQFANRFQDSILDEGKYDELIPYFNNRQWDVRTLTIEFRANKSIAYKEISLDFVYLVQQSERGFWIQIPVLGVETFAPTEEDIESATREVIQLDCTRHKRFEHLQNVISLLWFDSIETIEESVLLNTYTLSELEARKEKKSKSLLPVVAEKLQVNKRVLFGCEPELKQLGDILKSQYNRSTILVGKSGVGKTTLVWEAVRQRYELGFKQQIWETTASVLIKELTQQTGWQENLTLICQELRQLGDVLFVRNCLELFEVGQYEGNSVSMAEYMREYVARGEVTLLTECTDEELARIEMRNPNFTSLFNIIRLEEPTKDLESIILQKVEAIAKEKNVRIDTEAIRETMRLNRRYTPYSGFPGKPIRFLESILINVKHLSQQHAAAQLDRSAVIRAFCDETGMPEFMVNPQVPMQLADVRSFFLQNVFGQNHAVGTLVDMLASIKAAVLRAGKPIASSLFVGPTGVGKTEMAKVLAEFMFGSRDKMIRFDMSEYSTSYAVARLVGESYFSDGLLTSAVRREPFCVLLFDELEKAHPDFNDLLLQMLGEGRLTDSQGKVVNLCSTIIIMTSNIGANKLQLNSIGWNQQLAPKEVADFFENEVRKYFRPEIFNRIDQIVPFYPLQESVVRYVVEREIKQLREREGIVGRNLEWHFESDVLDYLAQVGYHAKYGARALQRTLREELVTPLAKKLNEYPFEEKLILQIRLLNGRIDIDVEADPLKLELMLEELTQNEFMDYASDLRQRIYRLFEGSFYTKFVSETSFLQREQQQKPKLFWNDAEKPRKLAYYTSLRERLEKAKADIDVIETDMALITMGLRSLNTKIYDKIKDWEKSYSDLKLELLALSNPEANTVQVGIYSSTLAPVFDFYQAICELKNYAWEAKTVWFRESLYNEIIRVERAPAEGYESEDNVFVLESDNAMSKRVESRKAKAYYKKVFVTDADDEKGRAKNLRPDEKGDVLVGIEMTIMGYGVQWYFEEEGGLHRVQNGDSETAFQKYYVLVGEPNYTTPEDIHRKSANLWQMRPRRTFYDQAIEDTTYNIAKRRAVKQEQTDIFIQKLDKLFSNRLDDELQA